MNRRGFIAKIMAIPAVIAAAIPFLKHRKPWARFSIQIKSVKDIKPYMCFRVRDGKFDGLYMITREAPTYIEWNGDWIENYRGNMFFAVPAWNTERIPYLKHDENGELLCHFGGVDVGQMEFYGTDFKIAV